MPILTWYRKWTAGETESKFLVAYVSMWGATEKLIATALDPFCAHGVTVAVHDLSRADLGALCAELVDGRALVFGASPVLGGLHPLAGFALNLVRALRPPVQYVIFFELSWLGRRSCPPNPGNFGPLGYHAFWRCGRSWLAWPRGDSGSCKSLPKSLRKKFHPEEGTCRRSR